MRELPKPTGRGSPFQPMRKLSERDPSLPSQARPLRYIDVFVDDFLGLSQGRGNGRRVRKILLHAVDDVLRPLEDGDNVHRKEPVSLKKLHQGDCSWSTIKTMLGWMLRE